MTRVAKAISGCQIKTTKILKICMEICNIICKNRLNSQLLHFMKLFKNYVEDNDVSHI